MPHRRATVSTTPRRGHADRAGIDYPRNVGAEAARGDFLLFSTPTTSWRATGRKDGFTLPDDSRPSAVPSTRTRFTRPRLSLPGPRSRRSSSSGPGSCPTPLARTSGYSVAAAAGRGLRQAARGGRQRRVVVAAPARRPPDRLRARRGRALPGASGAPAARSPVLRIRKSETRISSATSPRPACQRTAFAPPLDPRAHLVMLSPWYWWHPGRRRQWVRSAARRLGASSAACVLPDALRVKPGERRDRTAVDVGQLDPERPRSWKPGGCARTRSPREPGGDPGTASDTHPDGR